MEVPGATLDIDICKVTQTGPCDDNAGISEIKLVFLQQVLFDGEVGKVELLPTPAIV